MGLGDIPTGVWAPPRFSFCQDSAESHHAPTSGAGASNLQPRDGPAVPGVPRHTGGASAGAVPTCGVCVKQFSMY